MSLLLFLRNYTGNSKKPIAKAAVDLSLFCKHGKGESFPALHYYVVKIIPSVSDLKCLSFLIEGKLSVAKPCKEFLSNPDTTFSKFFNKFQFRSVKNLGTDTLPKIKTKYLNRDSSKINAITSEEAIQLPINNISDNLLPNPLDADFSVFDVEFGKPLEADKEYLFHFSMYVSGAIKPDDKRTRKWSWKEPDVLIDDFGSYVLASGNATDLQDIIKAVQVSGGYVSFEQISGSVFWGPRYKIAMSGDIQELSKQPSQLRINNNAQVKGASEFRNALSVSHGEYRSKIKRRCFYVPLEHVKNPGFEVIIKKI